MASAPRKDFLGLRVLWPKAGQTLARVEHEFSSDLSVVLVHGLHSGPISDWQDEEAPFWPVEFLGQDLKNTRILSFGYQTSKSTFRPDNFCEEGRVFSHAEALCTDLTANQTLQKGPSLVQSWTRPDTSSFWTLLTLESATMPGDPFQGAHSAKQVEVNGNCGPRSSVKGGDADEMVPGDSGLTCLRNEHVLHLHEVKHRTICKFSSQQDNNYDNLLQRIRAGRIFFTKDEEHIQKIRTWIASGDQGRGERLNTDDYERALGKRHPKTCEWFFQNEMFKNWASQTKKHDLNRLLWVTGSSGEGKSVLCSAAVESIRVMTVRPATPYVMLTYRKERTECNLASLLAEQLLDYLVEELGGVDTETLSLLNRNPAKVGNLHDMIKLLVGQCPAVYFFLDGLDEIKLSGTRGLEKKPFLENLESTIKFIDRLTRNDSTDVRLWCSSQKSQPVISWMKRLGAAELVMDKKAVKRDVEQYLIYVEQKTLQDMSDIGRKIARQKLSKKANTNFRWASTMKESLESCETSRLLAKTIEQGLPTNLRQIYETILEELRMQDHQDTKASPRKPPLSTYILSLLTFARRPLRVGELQEALSIVDASWVDRENGSCENLRARIMIRQQHITHRCKLFVEFIESRTDPDDGYMQLSHASVFEFLRGSMDSEAAEMHKSQHGSANSARLPSSPDLPVVRGLLIADACLKYLSQRRYARPLRKRSSADFETSTSPPEDVRHHKFLRYAAKYWYRHLQVLDNQAELCKRVKIFLLSPQFLTVVQVQSLFVLGHFIHSFDHSKDGTPLYGKPKMQRNLPEWFRTCNEGKEISRSYEIFLVEWSNFLQLGSTDFLNGEIERCLWGALGPDHFMHRFGTRIECNKSYLLAGPASATGGLDSGGECCFHEIISDDGTRVSTWQACTRPPFLYGEPETLVIDPALVGWDLYDPFHIRTFTFVADSGNSLARAAPIADGQHGLSVRIGGVKYLRDKRSWLPTTGRDDSLQRTSSTNPKPSRPYWEDILVQGPYEVRARRLMVISDSPETPGSAKLPSKDTQKQSKDDTDSSSESSIQDASISDCMTSADEYWTFGSSSEGPVSEKEMDELSESSEEASKPNLCPSADMESDTAQSKPDVVNDSSLDELCQDTVGADADDEAGPDDEFDPDDDEDNANHQPKIAPKPLWLRCDLCDVEVLKDFGFKQISTTFYRCFLCAEGISFDICMECFRKGGWCENKKHQLRKMTMQKGQLITLSVESQDDSRTGIMILVQRRSSRDSDEKDPNNGTRRTQDSGRAVFRYSSKLNSRQSLLHVSAPAMHPTLPLLAYALEGTKFLFANLEENTYLVHEIPYDQAEMYDDQKCSAVSVHLRFSPCGRYLHIARTTTTTSSRPGAGRRRGPEYSRSSASNHQFHSNETTGRLFIQILAVRLSKRNPCSTMPKTLSSRRGIGLGTWSCVSVQRLPYTFTWTEDHVYVAFSSADSMLRVIRIPLEANNRKSTDEEGTSNRLKDKSSVVDPSDKESNRSRRKEEESIETLAKPFPLPRSARHRAIHFFPPARNDTRSCTKIILGSAHGINELAQAPAVVYIGPEDVGEWIAAEDASHHEHKKRSDPHMEVFEDSDCDLIIPLLDFQSNLKRMMDTNFETGSECAPLESLKQERHNHCGRFLVESRHVQFDILVG
ncbi:hypothetical protein HDK64DRAFT_329208 [Phyllosticta capitalensis]